MAYIKCMLLPIMVYLITSVQAVSLGKLLPKKPTKVKEQYEELIYQSMKSIVSLDELVTTLSVQVAVLTTSLSQIKVDVKKLGEQNGELSRALKVINYRITENNDAVKVDVKKLEEQNGELSRALKVMNDKITRKYDEITTALKKTEKDSKSTKTEIAKLQSSFGNTKKDVETEIKKLKASDSEIKDKVANVNKQVAVVTAEQTGGNQKCTKVCAGTTGRYKSKWRNYSSMGIYSDVDIRRCGFVKVPTITTSLEGDGNHWTALGGSSVYSASHRGFRIYVRFGGVRKGKAKSWKWNVEWIAVGYTC